MACGDVLSLEDLQTAKKHQIFEAEVITGKAGGVSGGADIDFATNNVTGQQQETLPRVLDNANALLAQMGYSRIGTFSTGGVLSSGRQTLLWDIADGGDGQEYGWSGSFLPSGKVVPPGSTPMTTGGIAVGAWISRYDPELRGQLAQSIVYVRMYADTWDGVVNNTDAIRAAHQAANLFNATVSYAGIKHYAIDGNALIPVNTDVDFCGARAHILNGVVGNPSWSVFQTTYLVADPNTPITTASGTFTGSLDAGSTTPTKGLFDGDGFALVRAGYQIPNRDETGTVYYEQSFNVIRDGITTYPLSVSLVADAASLLVKYRKNTNRVVLTSPTLMMGGFNNLHFIDVSRCNVEVNGFTLDFNTAYTAVNGSNELLFVNYASNVTFNSIKSVGQDNTPAAASYVLKLNYAADVTVDSFISTAGSWPSMASYHINGLHVTRSALSRVDVHAGCHNLYVDHCCLRKTGVQYGWGGGEIKVTNCTFIDLGEWDGCVQTRVDYSGTFFGNITLDNATIVNEYTSYPCLVNLHVGASTTTYMPGTISVSNVNHVSNNWSRTVTGRMAMYIRRRAGTSGQIYAPINVNVNNVNVSYGYLKMYLDYGQFIRRTSVFRFHVAVRGIVATNIPPKNGGIYFTPGGDPSVITYVDISDSDYILVNAQESECVREVSINDSSVCGVDVFTGATNPPQVRLSDCEYRYPAGGYSGAVPIGGASTSATAFTCIRGGTAHKSGFDFSNVSSCQGLLILKSGSTPPTLPAGWTENDMFMGRKATIFE